MSQDLLEGRKDKVAVLTLNRPDRLNAMSPAMLDALLEALPRLVGTAKARELYYTADIVDASQARELGIVNRVVPDGHLEEETMALAARLAQGPRIAYRYMKRNFNAAESGTLKDLLDLEAWHHTRCGLTEDHREATKAFVEKRDPVFRGL